MRVHGFLGAAAMLAVTLSLFAGQTVSAQTAGNLIANPNMDVEGFDGSSTTFNGFPSGGSVPFVYQTPAAANWLLMAITFARYGVQTALVPSDLVPGGRMLHVSASNIALLQMSPTITATPPLPGPLGFCVWIKVVRGAMVGAGLAGASTEGNHSTLWQPIIVNQPNANSPYGSATVLPFASLDLSAPRLGDVEFYVQAATLVTHPLTSCPQKTLDSLATGRQPLNLPPQYPVIEHPQWTGPAPQAPYGQGQVAPAYVPGPNAPPPLPSNGPVPTAPSNAPGGGKK